MIRDRDYGPYSSTIFVEAAASLFRFLPSLLVANFVVGLPGFFLLLLLGADDWGPLFSLVVWAAMGIALAPIILSVLTLTILPGGYGLTAKELGAREMSPRERETVLAALGQIVAQAPVGMIAPSRWLVLDLLDPNAFAVGTTIYLNRGLIRSEFLEPVMAHELGHINHGDGRLVLALRRLVPPPFSYISFERPGCGALLWRLCFGGAGLVVTSLAWNGYWQKREYLADRFAFECGQAMGLIEHLELYQFFDVAVPFAGLRNDHPYTESRIARLLDYLEEEPESREAIPLETEAISRDRKQGFTDAEAVLDLVVLDEGHAGWMPPEQIEEEKAWMRANGRRIVEMARREKISEGRGVVSIVWTEDPAERYVDEACSYMPQYYHAEYLDDSTSAATRQLDSAMRAAWKQHVTTYDLEREVVVLVTSLNRHVLRYGTSHYLLGMRSGGAQSDRDREGMPQEQRRRATSVVRDTSQPKQPDAGVEVPLDLVIIAETHADWTLPKETEEKKAWIRKNGQRLIDQAHYGTVRFGRGVLYRDAVARLGTMCVDYTRKFLSYRSCSEAKAVQKAVYSVGGYGAAKETRRRGCRGNAKWASRTRSPCSIWSSWTRDMRDRCRLSRSQPKRRGSVRMVGASWTSLTLAVSRLGPA